MQPIVRRVCFICLLHCLPLLLITAQASSNPTLEAEIISSIRANPRDDARINQQAEQLAGIASMAGLQELIDKRKIEAIDQFYKIYHQPRKDLPKDLQALIVKNFDNLHVQAQLGRFVHKRPYDNSELHRLILDVAHRQEKVLDTFYWYELLLVSTTQGLEDRTIRLYRHMDNTGKKHLLQNMVSRKFPGALPYFIRYHDEMPLGSQSLYVHSRLVQYGTTEAASTLIELLKKYDVAKEDAIYRDLTASALLHLQQFPDTATLDFGEFISKIPFLKEAKIAKLFISLIKARQPREAVRYLLAYLHNKEHHEQAFDALASYVNLDVWRQTREALFKAYRSGAFDTSFHKLALARLDSNYQKYEQLAAASKATQADSAARQELQALQQQHGIDKLTTMDTNQVLRAYEAYLDQLPELYSKYRKHPDRSHISLAMISGNKKLGNIHRFVFNDGATARKLYRQAADTAADHKVPEAYQAMLLLAESVHFDEQDKDKAIKAYTDALDEMRRSDHLGKSPAVQQWLEDWIIKQVRFLNTGIPFKESASRSAQNFGAAITFMSDLLDLDDVQAFRQKAGYAGGLSQMVKSHFLFPYYILVAREQQPEDFLNKLTAIDPTGYWLANYFDFINLSLHGKQSQMSQNMWKMGKSLTVRGAAQQYRSR